jgi:RNA polymerase sigma-70 factor (sigma-E family)
MASFDEFFNEHYDEVVRTVALAVGDRPRAEDATQEAFARAYRKWGSVSRMDRPVGWVVVVAMNQLRRWANRVDRPERAHLESLDVRAAADVTSDPSEAVVDGATLQAALDRLAPRQRATVVLRFLCDLPTEDVARALGCSTGTVKSALHTALSRMRVELDDPERLDGLAPREATAAGRGTSVPAPIHDPAPEVPRHA